MTTLYFEVIGDEEISRKFANTPARMAQLQILLTQETELIDSAVTVLSAEFTGEMRAAWETAVGPGVGGLEGRAWNPTIQAAVLEHGRSPGSAPPPIDAIAPWVSAKLPGADPLVVARSIGAKGIEGAHMLEKAQAATLPVRIGLRSQIVGQMLEAS
ncbi:MAG: hypothetical protein WD739_07360 [Actinomycetota bacterium]